MTYVNIQLDNYTRHVTTGAYTSPVDAALSSGKYGEYSISKTVTLPVGIIGRHVTLHSVRVDFRHELHAHFSGMLTMGSLMDRVIHLSHGPILDSGGNWGNGETSTHGLYLPINGQDIMQEFTLDMPLGVVQPQGLCVPVTFSGKIDMNMYLYLFDKDVSALPNLALQTPQDVDAGDAGDASDEGVVKLVSVNIQLLVE